MKIDDRGRKSTDHQRQKLHTGNPNYPDRIRETLAGTRIFCKIVLQSFRIFGIREDNLLLSRDLGVLMSQNLKFKDHYNFIVKKAYQRLFKR
uniref:Uncharacterized protein n=1 Tax=Romanomermis culicivorax TaxID=13658 RepID=A0A915KB14_ROMCU